MLRSALATIALCCATLASAQTYFYIDEIQVHPAAPTTADDINIDLVGGLSSTGAYVAAAAASLNGNVLTINIIALDPGGAAVIVPHTETVHVGPLPAGTYTIVFNPVNVGDFAPSPQHQFTVVGGVSLCDSLVIASVQLHAFNSSAIVVHVFNNSTELFDYPNFILFDGNGDTLAVETTNFFGIASESWHVLALHPGAALPSAPFNGTLHLWKNFTTEFMCAWDLPVDLCPPAPCATMIVTMNNFGGAIPIGTYAYAIMDANLSQVATGELELTQLQQYDGDTLCIAPGNYTMVLSPNDPPTGGGPTFGVMVNYYIPGPAQAVSWDIPPQPMAFQFYAPCADGPNAIAEQPRPQPPTVLVHEMGISIRNADGHALGQLALFDAHGRLIQSLYSSSSHVDMPLNCAPGLLLLRTDRGTRKMVIE